jgi:hypothetical protein
MQLALELEDTRRPHLLCSDEVAHAIGRDRQHVFYLIRMGRLYALKVGRKWRIIPQW